MADALPTAAEVERLAAWWAGATLEPDNDVIALALRALAALLRDQAADDLLPITPESTYRARLLAEAREPRDG